MAHRGQYFENMSIRNKILLGYGALIVPFVVLIAMVWVMTSKTEREFALVQNDTIPFIRAVEEVRLAGLRLIAETSSFTMLALHERTASAAADIAPAEPEETSDLRAESAAIAGSGDEADGESLLEQEKAQMHAARAALADIRSAFLSLDGGTVTGAEQFRSGLLRVVDMLDSGSRQIEAEVAADASPSAAMDRLEALEEVEAALIANAAAALEHETALQKDHGDQLSAMLSSAVTVMTILGLLCTVGAVGGGVFIAERIAKPIRRLAYEAERLGQGDLGSLDRTTAGGEVGMLTGAIGKMVDDLHAAMDKMGRQQKLSALGQLAGTVGHDLRNPLAAIRTTLHTLRQTSQNKGFGIERSLDRMERSVDRCNAIVSDLLDFTRAPDLHREPTALDDWLGELLDEHKLGDGVALRREIACDVEALIDRDRFRRVMINLVDNAAQAMTSQGWSAPDGRELAVTVRAEAAGPHVRVAVADNGPGIGADSLAKIFEPLFTTKSSGVGLGLPIVRQIVEQHGGTIDVESRVDIGTTFTVFLPRKQSGQQPGSAAAPAHAAA